MRDLTVRVRDLEHSNLKLSRRVAHLEAEEFELLPDCPTIASSSSSALRPAWATATFSACAGPVDTTSPACPTSTSTTSSRPTDAVRQEVAKQVGAFFGRCLEVSAIPFRVIVCPAVAASSCGTLRGLSTILCWCTLAGTRSSP